MLFPQFPLKRKTNGVFVCVHTALLIIFLQERIPDQKQGMGSLLEQHVNSMAFLLSSSALSHHDLAQRGGGPPD